MLSLLYVVTTFVRVFLSILQLLMMVRVFMSWLPATEDSRFAEFVFVMTEPAVLPMRMLFQRFDALATLPLDLPFMASFIMVSMISSGLPAVI